MAQHLEENLQTQNNYKTKNKEESIDIKSWDGPPYMEDKMSPFITLNPWIVETNIQQDTTFEDYVLMIELDGHTKNGKIHLCDFPNYFPL